MRVDPSAVPSPRSQAAETRIGVPSSVMALSLEDARRAYAEEIRAVADIQCDRLIEAFARVPREVFLGSGPWFIGTGSRTRRFKMPAPDDPTAWEADYRAT